MPKKDQNISKKDMDDYLKNRKTVKKSSKKSFDITETFMTNDPYKESIDIDDNNKYNILKILTQLLSITNKDLINTNNFKSEDINFSEVFELYKEAYTRNLIKGEKDNYYDNNYILMEIAFRIGTHDKEEVFETYTQYRKRINVIKKKLDEKQKQEEIDNLKQLAKQHGFKLILDR